MRSTVALPGEVEHGHLVDPTALDSDQFPRLQQLLVEAARLGAEPLTSMVDDVLSLVIDVLIPALTSAGS